ncbi:major facilitator superfamily domain-containing protein [Umbelopsis sp. AD052]|nr:major facilitator superfamily domain-containing protein [Umbelopsis sp. AD052]
MTAEQAETQSNHSVKNPKDSYHLEEVLSNDDKKSGMNYDRIDPEIAKYASDKVIPIDDETNKRLKRLIDRRVLVIIVFTYFLQALDKGTLAFSSIMNLPKDTGLVGQQYAWLTTCIYIAILIVEYPLNWLIQRVPIGKFLAFNIICWSTVLALHALCKNFVSLLVVRTLLGIFEASCQPIFIALSSMWYKRDEQAQIVTYWYVMNGFQQIVGGLLAYAFTNITSGPLKSWQALFLTYGSFSFVWGIIVLFIMPDSPMRAKCYTEEDKKLMVERVRSNQTGLQNRTFRKEQFFEAFRDPQVWAYGLISFLTTVPTSGLGAFANIIITGFGFTVLQTQLLAMVLGSYIMIVCFSSMYLAKRFNQTLLVMTAYCVPSIVCTVVLMTVQNTSMSTKVGLLLSYYLVLSFWAASTLCMSLLTRNVGGQTKKATATAINFILWATGNAIGPQVFQAVDAPRYIKGFGVHLACYGVLFAVMLGLRFYFIRQNAKKAKILQAQAEQKDAELTHSFDDLTDMQNPNFVYIY